LNPVLDYLAMQTLMNQFEELVNEPRKTICKAYRRDWPYWLLCILFVLGYHWIRSAGGNTVTRLDMDRMLTARREYFNTELEEMKLRTQAHTKSHRAKMMAEADWDKKFFRQELHQLSLDYKETITMMIKAQDEHAVEAEKFRIEEKARIEKESHHKKVEDMAQSEIEKLDKDTEATRAQIKTLEDHLKTHEGEEIDRAIGDLKARMASYEALKARLLSIKDSTQISDKAEATNLKETRMPLLVQEIEELSNAIDAVVKAPHFAPEKPRADMIKVVNDAKSCIAGHAEL